MEEAKMCWSVLQSAMRNMSVICTWIQMASSVMRSQPGNPRTASKMLWDREEGVSAILTSGTLKAGADFLRTRQTTGLEARTGVQEYVAESPFSYEKNCLLYLPKTLEHCRRGSREEAVMIANHIHSLICSTYGHTLVLFTSYIIDGKCVPDFKRQPAFHGGSMEAFPGGDPAV